MAAGKYSFIIEQGATTDFEIIWKDLNLSGSLGNNPLSSGSIGIFISAASSSAFNFNEAKYDLEVVSGSYVTRLLEGRIKLSKEVTI